MNDFLNLHKFIIYSLIFLFLASIYGVYFSINYWINSDLNLVDYKNIKEVRVLGLIAVVEFVEISWLEILSMRKKAIELGVFLRPFANCIYLMPPLIIKKSELQKLVDAIYQMLKP